MTERPMDETEHPDEGLIHAWLDDALSAADAERLAAHVRTCADCQARVAEARGLIAGASRIVAALDDVPAGTRPGWAQGAVAGAPAGDAGGGAAPDPRAGGGSLWRWLRVTPGRAALAATILVAIGITLTYERASIESTPRTAMSVLNPQQTDVPAATSAEGGASEAAKPRDALLDSAVAKNVAIAQGKRVLEPARGPAVPAAPPPTARLQEPAGAAGEAVALGRAAEEARREAPSVAADRARSRASGVAASQRATSAPPPTDQPQPAPGAVTRAPAQRQDMAYGAMMADKAANAAARSCLLLESQDADARWADQPFPLVLAIEPGAADAPRDAAVLTPSGEVTSLRAQWNPRGGDSVTVRLRRIGYSGSIALGPEAGARSGIAVSAAATAALEQVVVGPPPAPARAESRKAAAAAAPTAAPSPPAGPPVRQLRVTARSIACPAR